MDPPHLHISTPTLKNHKIKSFLETIVSEYDQEIPQSQTADNPVAPRGKPLNHHETPGRQIKQSNQLSLPHQDDAILEWT